MASEEGGINEETFAIVTWKPHLWARANPATEAQVCVIEERFGIHFPPDYRNVGRIYQGMKPNVEFECFDYVENDRQITTRLDYLLHFDPEYLACGYILEVYESQQLPPNVVPIAIDVNGQAIAFDFRETQAPLVFCNTSGEMCFIASCFRDFLLMLTSDDLSSQSEETEGFQEEESEVFCCNECMGFIESVRWTCTICEDYDLCSDCHDQGVSSDDHNPSHQMTCMDIQNADEKTLQSVLLQLTQGIEQVKLIDESNESKESKE